MRIVAFAIVLFLPSASPVAAQVEATQASEPSVTLPPDLDAAYIIGGYAGERGKPDAGKFTLTLRKGANGRWLIVSDMDSSNSRPAGAVQPATAQGDARNETVKALQASAEEWNRGNLDGFIDPYHEGSMFMTRDGPIGRAAMRDRYEKRFFSGGKPLQQLRFDQLTVVPLAAEAALMTGRFVLSGGGNPDQSGWFTLIWMRTPQGWKIVHDHTS
ncbi:MAG TPA: nuclear transport factor 2 family protein [Vicinamibacterales bacterium]|nr:nuclear transport factor 2 family protein [Vicinamibacterales bacterium]